MAKITFLWQLSSPPHRDHFVCHLSVCLSVRHTFLSLITLTLFMIGLSYFRYVILVTRPFQRNQIIMTFLTLAMTDNWHSLSVFGLIFRTSDIVTLTVTFDLDVNNCLLQAVVYAPFMVRTLIFHIHIWNLSAVFFHTFDLWPWPWPLAYILYLYILRNCL